jgi:hypothetical protein
MLKEDGAKLVDVETSSTCSTESIKSSLSSSSKSSKSSQSNISLPSSSASTSQPEKKTMQGLQKEGRKEFQVRKTNLPDVYELFNADMSFVGFASVPSLTISKFMREAFRSKNIVDCVNIVCEYSERFNKWLPVTP